MNPRPAGAAARRQAAAWSDADRHLIGADGVLRGLMEAGGPLDPEDRRRTRPADAYGALLRSIVGQQLSTRAARSIWGRVAALFGDRTPTPDEILATDPDALRAAGLSGAKVSYIRDLAAHVKDRRLDLASLDGHSDEEVIAELTSIKGIGRWTAEMFLIFHLRRPDVVSTGDLGIRRAIQVAYGLDQVPAPTEIERIAEPWRPHRSLACLYLWRSLDNQPIEPEADQVAAR